MTTTSMNLIELIRKSRDDGADMDVLVEDLRQGTCALRGLQPEAFDLVDHCLAPDARIVG